MSWSGFRSLLLIVGWLVFAAVAHLSSTPANISPTAVIVAEKKAPICLLPSFLGPECFWDAFHAFLDLFLETLAEYAINGVTMCMKLNNNKCVVIGASTLAGGVYLSDGWEPTNQVFWVKYQTNQPVKIRTHQFINATGQWAQTLFNVADMIGAFFRGVSPAELGQYKLHAVVNGVESTLPGNQQLSLIPTTSCSFDNPLIIKSLNGIENTHMDLSRRDSDPWGNEVAVLLESIGSNDSEEVIIGEKRTVAREEAVTNILGVFQNNNPLLIKSPPMSGKTSMANLISHRLKTTAREKCLILKVSMLNLTRHGTGRTFESAFEEEVRVKWGDLPTLARNRKIYLIFDEVQVLYRRPVGDRPASPKFKSDVFWTMVKSIMVDHSSGIHILLFSCYESNSESSFLATPVKFTTKSMLGINWLNFSDADLKDYVYRNLLARDGMDDLSLDLFCTNLKRITAGHVGFCHAAVHFLNGILASQRRSGTLTVKHVLKSLNDSRLFTHLRETCAFDGAKNVDVEEQKLVESVVLRKDMVLEKSSLGIKQRQIADSLVLKGVFVEHGVVNLQYVFSSPVMRRFFTEMVSGVPAERAQKNPDTLDDLVYAIVSSIDYEHIKSSLGKTKKTGVLLERAWQMEFYKASHQCTSDYVTSADVGGLFGTPGAIDFTVQSDDMEVFWGIELLLEGIRLEDHVGRFKNGGRYEVMCRMFSETCVLDIRRQPKGTAPNLEDLDKHENLMIFTYDESFSEGALYSKSCVRGKQVSFSRVSQS
ncbi:hypothetical protein CcCBS67573_g08978 [Chytriomyces confervae]|uniref:ATPase AAA-type core domain-containing protein n=1 Tax=Chytriomyces confervae TaxID=246404 RepID=A0A507EBH3_9FUNG|nr:hypothetical protein CcCBS67573_g08978 [Chytriomyces confervae]